MTEKLEQQIAELELLDQQDDTENREKKCEQFLQRMTEEYDTYKAEVLSEPADEHIFPLAVMGRFKAILLDFLKYHNEESLDAFLDMDTPKYTLQQLDKSR